MEFHDLGKHCSAQGCRRQDFLPFSCNACTEVFCLDHRSHAGHNCTNSSFNDKRVLECSKCKKVLRRPPGVEHSLLLERHVVSGCVTGIQKAKPNKIGCSFRGCRGSEFVKVTCGSCRENFCFRHRHEEDHKCQAAAEASTREHPHLQKRSIGAAGGAKPSLIITSPMAGKPAAGAGGNSRQCGREAGEAAARRERKGRTGGGAGTGNSVTAR